MHDSTGDSIWEYSAIIFAVVLVSKLLSKRTNTVDVLWLVLGGALLTNLRLLPTENEFLENIGEWGIVFIMFALGLEEDLKRFYQGVKRGLGVALIGAAFPFIAGYSTARWNGYDHRAAMLWALTMTATAVSLTMMSLRGDLLHKSTAATGIMTAAIIDDVLSLMGVAIMVPLILAGQGGSFGPNEMVWILGKVVLFFSITLFIGLVAFPEYRPKELPENPTRMEKVAFRLNRLTAFLGARRYLMLHRGEFTPLITLSFAMVMGVVAHRLGFHPAIGAYFAGLFLDADYFWYSSTRQKTTETGEVVTEEAQNDTFKRTSFVISHLAFTIFGPIFFVNLGGKLKFDQSVMQDALPPALVLYVTVLVLQVLSAGLAARYTGRYEWHESVMIGLGMLGRAELAFIVINIAYVQSQLIDLTQFYTLMFTTFLLNITVPLVLKWWKPYYLGFKQLRVLGVQLSRAEPAAIPSDMPEHREQMEEEKRQYMGP